MEIISDRPCLAKSTHAHRESVVLIIVIRDVGAGRAARSFGVLCTAAVVELGSIGGIIGSQLVVPSRAEDAETINPSSEQPQY